MASHMDARRKSLALPVTLASGGQVVLTIVVTASPVKGLIGDDDASVISGVSGISGSPVGMEQDLNGFDMGSRGSSGALSDTAKAATSADAAPRASHEHQMSPLSSIPERQSSEVAAAVQELEQESAPPADTQEHEEVSVGTPPAALSAPSEAPPPEPQATVDTPQSQEGDSATPQSGSMGELAHEDDVHEAEGEHEEQYHDEHAEGEEEEEYYDEYDGADVAELEERLHAAEEAAAEAEAMAEEAVAMLESEQAGKRQAEALVAQLQRELEWAGKKAAKERTEWEARMKDSFK